MMKDEDMVVETRATLVEKVHTGQAGSLVPRSIVAINCFETGAR
jgi:hypothetical protein